MATLYKKHGIWCIAYELPRGADGKRRRRVISCSGLGLREARLRLAEIERELARGTLVEPSKISVAEYLLNWLESRRTGARRLASTTLWGYACYINNHIIPHIGDICLNKLQPIHIDQMMSSISHAGLAPKTVREVFSILHAALTQAVKLRLIPTNPADAVDPPSVVRSRARVVDAQGLQRILEAAYPTQHWIPVLIAAMTGMRRGEICGLRWEDIHFDRAVAIVRRSVVQLPGRPLEIKSTKSGKERLVALPQALVQELRRHRQRQLQSGPPFVDRGWVCTTATGEVYPPDRLTDAFPRLAAKAGVDITLHGLRHSQASILLDLGHPLPAISERLGHANVSITASIYSHALPHQQIAAAATFDQLLRIPGQSASSVNSGKDSCDLNGYRMATEAGHGD